MIELNEVWDFHTDVRLLVKLGDDWRLPRLIEQMDLETAAQLGGIFSATGRSCDKPRDRQWERLEGEVGIIENLPGLTVARTRGDLEGAGRQILHAEGIYFITSRSHLDDLERLWERGFRSIAPMYNEDNALGGGARGDRGRGLTPLGRQVCEKAWERGFMVDAAHANHKTLSEMIELAAAVGRPVHYTHGHLDEPVLEIFQQRGLPRPLVERLAATGGLVGLSPYPAFVGYWRRFMDEVAFLADVAPHQAVLGTDFTGMVTAPLMFPQFAGAAATPEFAEMLAGVHGEQFARDFCGRTLRGVVEESLPVSD